MGLLWHLLYYPMAVVWLALCAVHTALAWPLRGLEWVMSHLLPGLLFVAWRADGKEGMPDDIDDADDDA